ncbi:MAG: cytochrome b/b6 domain-containing protein [Rhodobacter sp.]|nr:cytochrome b/b6 domain-containing protein [Paracoccaceae bacterium]MCC0076673.1 cytochrome b/b6 domain-containing protein [Rhodobacter sp.]
MRRYPVWDPFIRLFHWSLVGLFAANALVLDPESKIHRWVGYTIAALVALRIGWGLVGPLHARFASFAPTPATLRDQLGDMLSGRRRVHLGHTPLGALMIANLLLTIIAIAVTGTMMTTLTYWGVKWVEDLHEALVTWAELSVVAHVAAVIWESRRTGVNLPRAMVNGTKHVPADCEIADAH